MNHLILVAYPIATDFTFKMANAYAEQLRLLGHEAQTVDLFRVKFNSVLNDKVEIVADKSPDEINAISQSDVLTLLYPLWWLSMPALMKGYINSVFKNRLGYDSNNAGLLMGKKAVLITVSGASLTSLVENGRWNALQTQQNADVLHSAGFDLMEHLHFSDITPMLPQKLGEEYIDRVRDFACQHFAH